MKNSVFKTAGNYVKNHKYVLWLLYYVVYFALYILAEHVVTDDYWVSYWPAVDDAIPFCEWFIIPYGMWYIAFVTVPLYFLIKDQAEDFKRYMIFFAVTNTLTLLFYLVFPNGQNLRPEVMPRENIASELVKRIYAADTNTNVLPSLHALGAFNVMLGLFAVKPLQNWWGRTISVIFGFAVCMATVFLKQHSILDVIAAVALGLVAWIFIWVVPAKIKRKKKTAV